MKITCSFSSFIKNLGLVGFKNDLEEYVIIDKAFEVEGFYFAAGHSGHGFKIASAVGKCIAELITEGMARTVDISPFPSQQAFPRDESIP